MTIKDLYNDAIREKDTTLLLVLDYLVIFSKTLKLTDDKGILLSYLSNEESFQLNTKIKEYKGQRIQSTK
ncbi:hypothetical protein [Alkalihalobacillus sp. CinArs1]|uniref:hypothetical protein n=1 Tax=Alkalihalobacillus sp. CinArs1 TaxID=2995314 RepID=UPI0022DD90D0|nr:hypothetical protein [Alkalihalobacillus sp. CinArs1]